MLCNVFSSTLLFSVSLGSPNWNFPEALTAIPTGDFLLAYSSTVSHVVLIFQKSVDSFRTLVNHFLFVISFEFIPFCFSMKVS